MIKTIKATTRYENLIKATIKVFVNDLELTYTDVKEIQFLSDEDVKEIESNLNDEEIDKNHKYFKLIFSDKTIATFNESENDLFII